MEKVTLSRKLAVILHADVVGSASLVQKNEAVAHERIRDAFDRFSKIIESYGGITRELRGDAILAEFQRASDAVSAALAFQEANRQFNSNLADEIRPLLRIGAGMGEVIIADNTVTGSGVVIAQRVEQLAESGGLCITAALHEALPKHLPFDLDDIGEQVLKGFDDRVHVYRVSLGHGESVPPPEPVGNPRSAAARRQQAAYLVIVIVVAAAAMLWFVPSDIGIDEPVTVDVVPLEERPSIAVLPFDNMSDDPEQVYFSDGISEDIITDLSQLNSLAVISRNSSFSYRGQAVKAQDIGRDLGVNYLLEGSVRKMGEQLRITVQLIDTGNGHHLWAERFDRQLTDIFALQDEITEKIVSALSLKLTGNEKQQLAHDATKSIEAYDLFLRAQVLRADYSLEGLGGAAELLQQAIDIDPGFARAYGALAIAVTRQGFAAYTDSFEDDNQRALELARKAVKMAPYTPQVHWALGYVYLYRTQFDEAIEALERSVSLSPSYADGYALLALINNNLGQAEEAIRLIEKGMYLNPHYSWDYLYNLGRAHYTLGNYDKAVDYLTQALERNESPSYPRLFLIASYVELDQPDDAEWEVEQLEMFHPELTISSLWLALPIKDPQLKERFVKDLKTAGIAE